MADSYFCNKIGLWSHDLSFDLHHTDYHCECGWEKKEGEKRVTLLQLRELNERQRDLLEQAYQIINEYAPGHTVWLDEVEEVMGRKE